jgi:hypothetical protein
MRRTLLSLAASACMLAAPAHAGPSNNKHFLFPTMDECTIALWNLFRGNHAYYCVWTPEGAYITEDFSIKENRKGPNR